MKAHMEKLAIESLFFALKNLKNLAFLKAIMIINAAINNAAAIM